jgi:ribonuclease-3
MTDRMETALTHSSYANETGAGHNERLEFLGDAILGFITAEALYTENLEMQEGGLTKLRAGYVCEKNLASAARRLGLGERLRLGRGETVRDSMLADAFEAVLAAAYLDGGMEPCREMVKSAVLDHPPAGPVRDEKSCLQEALQGQGRPAPEYRTVRESGPDHKKEFIVEAVIDGRSMARGTGKTKKAAEMDAAGKALDYLTGNNGKGYGR